MTTEHFIATMRFMTSVVAAQRESHPAFRLRANVLAAFRENLAPAFFLQLLALLIALCYFFVPLTRPLFNFLAALKESAGPWYAIFSTSLFGGLIPFSFLALTGKIRKRVLAQGIFYILLWGFMGLVIDAFYTQQAIWFGADNDLATVTKKVAFDQLVFSTFVSCPFLTGMYLWKDNDFSGALTRSLLNREFFALQIPTTIAINWLVWTPAVSVIYALPSSLQVPLFNIVLCFFVLLLAVLKRG